MQIKKFLNLLPGICSIICLIYFFNILFISSKTLNIFQGADYNWILKTGEWIYINKSIPHTNILGGNFQELTNIQYVVYQWLFKLASYIIYKYFNLQGLIWMVSSILTLSLGFISIYLYKRNYKAFPEIFLSIITILPIISLFESLRPYIITILFASILNLLLLKKENNYVKWIFIPLLFLIWANSHLGFIFGIAWLLIELLFQSIKKRSLKPLLPFIFSLIITFANPNGILLYKYLFELGNSPFMNSLITELHSINFHNIKILISMIFIIIAFAYTSHSKNIKFSEKVLFIMSLTMSLFSIRHLCFLLIFSPIFIAEFTRNFISPKIKHYINVNAYTEEKDKILLHLFFVILTGFVLTINKTISAPSLPQNITTNFIKYLNEHPPKSLILSDELIGSELLFFTPHRSLIDSRLDMYGDKYVEEYFKELLHPKSNWQKLYKNKKINYIIVNKNKDSYYYQLNLY